MRDQRRRTSAKIGLKPISLGEPITGLALSETPFGNVSSLAATAEPTKALPITTASALAETLGLTETAGGNAHPKQRISRLGDTRLD
jgi:hypothetical protein